MLFAPLIARLYVLDTSGAERTAQLHVLTVFTLWFLPQMIFYGFTALATALLNAHRRFVAAAFAPVAQQRRRDRRARRVRAHDRGSRSGWIDVRRIRGDAGKLVLLGLGTTAGIVAMALVLVPALRRAGPACAPPSSGGNPAVRKMLRLSGWTVGYVVDEPGRAAVRARAREERHDRRRVRVPLRVHVLPGAARPARGVDHDDDDAGALAQRRASATSPGSPPVPARAALPRRC